MFKFLLGLSFLFLSCNSSDRSQNNSAADTKQPDKQESFPKKELVIANSEEEGWGADIRLSIVSVTENDTTKMYTVISTYQGNDVGLMISVPKAKEGAKGFGKGIIFTSIGTESDKLLQTLAKLYKQKADTSLKFTPNLSVTFVNLQEFAKSLGAKDGEEYTVPSEYKLFFEGSGQDDYAELYLNINPAEHWLELREKDEEYRPALIKLFRK